LTEPLHEKAGIAASPYRPLSSGHVRQISDAAFKVDRGGKSPAPAAGSSWREGLGPKESERQL